MSSARERFRDVIAGSTCVLAGNIFDPLLTHIVQAVIRGILGVAGKLVKLHHCHAHGGLDLLGGSLLQSRKACAAEVPAQKCRVFSYAYCYASSSSSALASWRSAVSKPSVNQP